MNFDKPDRKARLKQLGFLIRHTFTIVGRNRALLGPLFVMWAYAAAMVTLFFVGIALIFYANSSGTWFLLGGVAMFTYKFFFYNRAELTLSRMTHGTATGGTPTRQKAKAEIASLGSQIRVLGLLDMAAAWIASRKEKQGGMMALMLGGIGEVWDLVNHFLLPAFAIDRLSLKDGVARLRRLKDHVPETLTGVFGIDIMAGVIGTLMGPLYAVGAIAGVAFGLLLGGHLPGAFSAGTLEDWFSDMPDLGMIGPETVFSWLPVFIIVFLGVFFHALLGRTVTAIKVVYFTLFYTRIMHPDALAPEVRADLEGYLDLDDGETTSKAATA